MATDIDDILGADDLVGVLSRDVRVRLVNISVAGCLMECATRLEPGTAGQLAIRVSDALFADDVRVTRVQQVQGAGGLWHVGAEFLWTTQPGPSSLRRVVSRLRHLVAQPSVEIEFTPRPM